MALQIDPKWLASAAVATLLSLSGCARQYEMHYEGSDQVFTHAKWVVVLIASMGMVSCLLIVSHPKITRIYKFCFLLLAAGLTAPLIYHLSTQRVIIDSNGLWRTSGPLNRSRVCLARYDDIKKIEFVIESHWSRKRRFERYLVCNLKTGTEVRIPLGALVGEASPYFAGGATNRGIPVEGD